MSDWTDFHEALAEAYVRGWSDALLGIENDGGKVSNALHIAANFAGLVVSVGDKVRTDGRTAEPDIHRTHSEVTKR